MERGPTSSPIHVEGLSVESVDLKASHDYEVHACTALDEGHNETRTDN
jgi:hypothetical protein